MAAVKVSDGGRVVIPADLRAKHGIAVGDQLFWREDGDQLVLSSRMAGIRRVHPLTPERLSFMPALLGHDRKALKR